MPLMPSVIMIEGMRSTVTPNPLTVPTASPTASAAAMARGQGFPSRSMEPLTAAAMPRIDPTDTSISPVMITRAMPSATTVYTTELLNSSRMLDEVKKPGLTAPTPRNITTIKPSAVTSRECSSFLSMLHSPFLHAKGCGNQRVLADLLLAEFFVDTPHVHGDSAVSQFNDLFRIRRNEQNGQTLQL